MGWPPDEQVRLIEHPRIERDAGQSLGEHEKGRQARRGPHAGGPQTQAAEVLTEHTGLGPVDLLRRLRIQHRQQPSRRRVMQTGLPASRPRNRHGPGRQVLVHGEGAVPLMVFHRHRPAVFLADRGDGIGEQGGQADLRTVWAGAERIGGIGRAAPEKGDRSRQCQPVRGRPRVLVGRQRTRRCDQPHRPRRRPRAAEDAEHLFPQCAFAWPERSRRVPGGFGRAESRRQRHRVPRLTHRRHRPEACASPGITGTCPRRPLRPGQELVQLG
jgi:hypothetical protein